MLKDPAFEGSAFTDAGRLRVSSYLHRFHNAGGEPFDGAPHVLIKYGMRRLPANARCRPTGRPWHRYEKSQPGHRLQIDVKFPGADRRLRKHLYRFYCHR